MVRVSFILRSFVSCSSCPPNPSVASRPSGACLNIIFISIFLLLFVFSHYHISLSFPPSFPLFFCFTSSTLLVYDFKLNTSSALFWHCVYSLRLLRSHDHYNDLFPPPRTHLHYFYISFLAPSLKVSIPTSQVRYLAAFNPPVRPVYVF